MTPSTSSPAGLTGPVRLSLVLALLAASSGSSVLFTVLPALAEQTGLTATGTGALITASGVFYAFGAPWWGRRSDRWGRARVVSIGLLGYGVAFLALAVVAQLGRAGVLTGAALFAALLATRPVGGWLAAAVPPAAQAAVADRTTAEQRTAGMALLGVASGLGLLVGPAIGAVGGLVDVLAPVWAIAAFALVLAGVVPLALRDPPRVVSHGAGAAALRLTDPRPRPWLLAMFAVFAVVAVVASTTGYLIQDRLDVAPEAVPGRTGLFLVVVGVGLIGAQVLVRRVPTSPHALLTAGGFAAAAGLGVYGLAPTLPVLLAAALLQGGGVGLILPGLLTGASLAVGPGDQGAVAGLVTFAQAIAFAVGPLTGGLLYDTAPAVFAPLGAAVFLGVAAAARGLRRTAAQPDPGA